VAKAPAGPQKSGPFVRQYKRKAVCLQDVLWYITITWSFDCPESSSRLFASYSLPFHVLGNIGGYEPWKQQPVRKLTPRVNKTIEIFL
jgi:hypothetical protein